MNIEDRLEQLGQDVAPGPSIRDAVIRRMENLPDTPHRSGTIWRTVMRKTWKPLSGVAALLILYMIFFSSDLSVTYAIEQTLEACKDVYRVHVKFEPLSYDNYEELWIEYEKSSIKRMRLNLSFSDDGPQDRIWQNGELHIWFKDKNRINIGKIEDPKIGLRFDHPKWEMEQLQKRQNNGEVTIRIIKPENEDEPTILRVIRPKPSDRVNKYFIDPKTKLLQKIESYVCIDGKESLDMRVNYMAYNHDIDENVFQFNAPDDVITIDWARQKIGILRGELSEKEVCRKALNDFFQALMNKDYVAAGRIKASGEEWAKEVYGDCHIKRILSIGEPTPHYIPGYGGYLVPYLVEIEDHGECSSLGVGIRENRQQPGFWYIEDGPVLTPIQKKGLPQGELTVKEICRKVVREFLEAWKNRDYSKAASFHVGMGGERAVYTLENYTITQVLSVGEPVKNEEPGLGGYRVPFSIEMIRKGERQIIKAKEACVRESRNCPGYWYIHEGVL